MKTQDLHKHLAYIEGYENHKKEVLEVIDEMPHCKNHKFSDCISKEELKTKINGK